MKTKTKKLYSGQIPFNLDGNLMNYQTDIYLDGISYNYNTKIFTYLDYNLYEDKSIEKTLDLNNYAINSPICAYTYGGTKRFRVSLTPIWKDNYVFISPMKFIGFERGRSAAHAIFHDENNKSYVMFLTDLSLILKNKIMNNGIIEGKWTFCKRGSNYAVCAAPE